MKPDKLSLGSVSHGGCGISDQSSGTARQLQMRRKLKCKISPTNTIVSYQFIICELQYTIYSVTLRVSSFSVQTIKSIPVDVLVSP